MIDHLEAENAQLKAHNRQLVEALESVSKLGTDKRKAHSGPCGQDSNSMHLNRMLFQQATDFKIIALEALQAPHVKLAQAEADVLKAAETLATRYFSDHLKNRINKTYTEDQFIQAQPENVQDLLRAVKAMKEARGDDR